MFLYKLTSFYDKVAHLEVASIKPSLLKANKKPENAIHFKLRLVCSALLKATIAGLRMFDARFIDPYAKNTYSYDPSYKEIKKPELHNYVKEVQEFIETIREKEASGKLNKQELINKVAEKMRDWFNLPKIAIYLKKENHLSFDTAVTDKKVMDQFYADWLRAVAKSPIFHLGDLPLTIEHESEMIRISKKVGHYFEPNNRSPSVPVSIKIETTLSRGADTIAGFGVSFASPVTKEVIGIAAIGLLGDPITRHEVLSRIPALKKHLSKYFSHFSGPFFLVRQDISLEKLEEILAIKPAAEISASDWQWFKEKVLKVKKQEEDNRRNIEANIKTLYAFGELAAAILEPHPAIDRTEQIVLALANVVMNKLEEEREEVRRQQALVEKEKMEVRRRAGFNIGPSGFFANAGIIFSDIIRYTQRLQNCGENEQEIKNLVSLVNIIFSIHEKVAEAFGWGVDKIVGDEIMLVSNVQNNQEHSFQKLSQEGILISFNILRILSGIDYWFKTKLIPKELANLALAEMFLKVNNDPENPLNKKLVRIPLFSTNTPNSTPLSISIPWNKLLAYSYYLSRQKHGIISPLVKQGLHVSKVFVCEMGVESTSDHSFAGEGVATANRIMAAASSEPSALFFSPSVMKNMTDFFQNQLFIKINSSPLGPYKGIPLEKLIVTEIIPVKHESYPVNRLRFNNDYFAIILHRYKQIENLLKNKAELYRAYTLHAKNLNNLSLEEYKDILFQEITAAEKELRSNELVEKWAFSK